ncbi:hypothetical protein [Lacimicrobium alkaliphilum]|nr:hypothetical protein [Lacimicrobium alkaliphilum]
MKLMLVICIRLALKTSVMSMILVTLVIKGMLAILNMPGCNRTGE